VATGTPKAANKIAQRCVRQPAWAGTSPARALGGLRPPRAQASRSPAAGALTNAVSCHELAAIPHPEDAHRGSAVRREQQDRGTHRSASAAGLRTATSVMGAKACGLLPPTWLHSVRCGGVNPDIDARSRQPDPVTAGNPIQLQRGDLRDGGQPALLHGRPPICSTCRPERTSSVRDRWTVLARTA
jgi:hypothetical protein